MVRRSKDKSKEPEECQIPDVQLQSTMVTVALDIVGLRREKDVDLSGLCQTATKTPLILDQSVQAPLDDLECKCSGKNVCYWMAFFGLSAKFS